MKEINTTTEIEVVDEKHERCGRIRIRESQGISGVQKCSIFLTPDQLDKHAQACLTLAADIRHRQTALLNDSTSIEPPLAGETPASEADRARYLGMTIDQYRKMFPKGSP